MSVLSLQNISFSYDKTPVLRDISYEFEKGKMLENVSILDLAPTIAKIRGVPKAREWEGKALV